MDQNAKLIGTGAAGAVLSLLCCVTPVLAVLARRSWFDRLRCKARLRARPRVRSVCRACDLRGCTTAAELRREDIGAKLADRPFNHHLPLLRASGDRTNAGGRLSIRL